LILAKDLNYGNSDSLKAQISEVSRLLEAYTRAVMTPK
jgi:hypothetical protein